MHRMVFEIEAMHLFFDFCNESPSLAHNVSRMHSDIVLRQNCMGNGNQNCCVKQHNLHMIIFSLCSVM